MSFLVGPAEQCGYILRQAQAEDGLVIRGARQIDARKAVHVALEPDDVLRNMEVALMYSLTSARMNRQLTPPWAPGAERPPTNANWFTVAQWAVLTVGRNLRSDAAPHRASVLPGALRRRLTPAVLSLRAADDRRVAAALSYGQVMVFASVYQALLQSTFADLPTPQEAALPRGVDERRPDRRRGDQRLEDRRVGDAERNAVIELASQLGVAVDIGIDAPDFYERVLELLADRAGYQPEITRALRCYERARAVAEDPSRSMRSVADLIFEANLRISAIEQMILDDAVTQVIDHVPRHYAAQAEGRLATFAERSLRVPRRIAQVSSTRRISSAAAVATDMWARLMTDQVMVVAFPAETIRLGRDIPRRDWRRPFYAPDLEELSPPAQALFDLFDRSLGDGRGAGAGDWRRFDDRLNFVANLLRSRQQDPTLFWQPFTDEDVVRVWHCRYPARMADPFEQAVRTPWLPDEVGRGLGGGAPE